MAGTEDEVKGLLRDGRHREAAELLLARGELRRAMEAYAAVWDYARAAEVALAARDRPAALDYLLRAGDRAGAAELRASLVQAPAEEADRALDLLLRRGEKDQAARLLEARGELVRAAELARDLGELRRAAALLERAGQLREAGRIYERLVAESPDDAASALSLGTILRHFGKHELAARMLQTAVRDPKLHRAALRQLVVALHGLGLRDAAASALEQLLEADGSAPRTVEALVAGEQEAARSAAEGEGQWVGGRYQVLRVLGGGAAGRVYLARDALYEREVALKVLAAGSTDVAGRDAFARFAREAQVAAKLDHPNIVRVLDFDESSGVLVMEHLDGGTLADHISQGPVPLAEIREVLLGVLAALETAHLRGVVHRDIKPQNVLFSKSGAVKLVDFGVAHLQDLGLTQTGAFIGTLSYMSPEQITGDKVGAATDLYGLGATVFHALCGRPPFVGADLIGQHLAEEPPLPSQLRPALGPRFDDLLRRLLAKVPADRFTSAAEVRRAVLNISFEEPDEVAAPAPPPPSITAREAAPEEVYVGTGPPEPVPGGVARRARHRALDVAVSILALDDAAVLARIAAMGRAVSSCLQCVLDVDAARGEAVVELPEGEPLSARLAAVGRLAPREALEATANLAMGLSALHAAGAAHGEVGPERAVVSRHRAVLLLPERAATEATPADDVRALEALLATSLGVAGGLAAAFEAGPLADELGPRRAGRLAEAARRPLDLPGLARLIDETFAALDDRRRAREHLHALAAAARAAGADPHSGPIADLIKQRAAELDA